MIGTANIAGAPVVIPTLIFAPLPGDTVSTPITLINPGAGFVEFGQYALFSGCALNLLSRKLNRDS